MKIYSLYEKMKGEDNSKFYLFRVGIFYMFLDDDAYYISKRTNLKLYYDIHCIFYFFFYHKYVKITP